MSLTNTTSTYGSVSKFFHWLIFVLLTAMLIFGYLLDEIPEDYQAMAYNVHKLTGLTILLLMVLRAIWVISNPKPAIPAGTPGWQRFAEITVRVLLYISIIAMPLVGWIGSCAAGRAPHIGDFQFNLPIAENKPLVQTMFELHGTFAIMIIVLASIHILAALYHYFIERDEILQRML